MQAGTKTPAKPAAPTEEQIEQYLIEEEELPPRGIGFHWYQLLTHALLHADIMHLAGNLLFLLVFGMRVNELIGNVAAAIVYLAGASFVTGTTIVVDGGRLLQSGGRAVA